MNNAGAPSAAQVDLGELAGPRRTRKLAMRPLSFSLALLEDSRRDAPGRLGRRAIDVNQVLMIISLLQGQVPVVKGILLRFDPLRLVFEAGERCRTLSHGAITFLSHGSFCGRRWIGHLH